MLRFKQFLILENDAETGSFNMGQWSKNYKDEVDKIYKDLYQKHKNDIDPVILNTSFNGNVEEYIRTKFMNPEEESMDRRASSYYYSPLDIDDPKYKGSLVKLKKDPATPRANNFKSPFYTPLKDGPVPYLATNPNGSRTPLIDYTKPVLDQDLSTTFPAPGEIKPSTPQQAMQRPARLPIGQGAVKNLGAAGLAAAGSIVGSALTQGVQAGTDMLGMMGMVPQQKDRMYLEKQLNSDIGLQFDLDADTGELIMNPAGREAVRKRTQQGISFPTVFPDK
jgi:hypothetical protein